MSKRIISLFDIPTPLEIDAIVNAKQEPHAAWASRALDRILSMWALVMSQSRSAPPYTFYLEDDTNGDSAEDEQAHTEATENPVRSLEDAILHMEKSGWKITKRRIYIRATETRLVDRALLEPNRLETIDSTRVCERFWKITIE